jgi:hypothetical protein
VPLEGIPQSSVGAPIPFILANEDRVVLAYYLQEREPGWDGTTVRVVHADTTNLPIALVRFSGKTHMFGPPNDETFAGHPLASRGLRPYGAFEIKDSSWIRKLERMNSLHSCHRPEAYWKLRHLIFAFHDSTFECVCGGFDITLTRGSIHGVILQMLRLLQNTKSS